MIFFFYFAIYDSTGTDKKIESAEVMSWNNFKEQEIIKDIEKKSAFMTECFKTAKNYVSFRQRFN